MDRNPIQNAERQARRERKLGAHPVCMLCGNEDIWALREAPDRFLEEHHVAGRQHDTELTAAICFNCHAVVHEKLRQRGVSLSPASSYPERLAEMLVAIGTFLKMLGERLILYGEQLFESVCALVKPPEAS